MDTRYKAIGIVGCGMVGSVIANDIVLCSLTEKLLINSRNGKRVKSEILDLVNARPFVNEDTELLECELEEMGEAEVVIIASGRPQFTPEEKRDALFEDNREIIREIAERLPNKDAIILMVTNPVEKLCDYFMHYWDGKRVYGTGIILDNMRAKAIGLHSEVTGIHGKELNSMLDENTEEVMTFASRIIEGKDRTYFGIGMAIAFFLKRLRESIYTRMPITINSRRYNGFYGVPCMVGKMEITEI